MGQVWRALEELLGLLAANAPATRRGRCCGLPGGWTRRVRLPVRVADGKVAVEPLSLPVGEGLGPGEQGSADAEEGVIPGGPPVQRGLLDTASALVEGVAGQLHDMEGVQDSGRVWQLVTDRVHVAAEGWRAACSKVTVTRRPARGATRHRPARSGLGR